MFSLSFDQPLFYHFLRKKDDFRMALMMYVSASSTISVMWGLRSDGRRQTWHLGA
jgi:hypothetical protein